jgi:hypothetical protein
MHYAISNEMAKSRIANWHRQAEREAVARAAAPAANPPRAARMRRAIAAAYRSSRASAIVAAVAR